MQSGAGAKDERNTCSADIQVGASYGIPSINPLDLLRSGVFGIASMGNIATLNIQRLAYWPA